MDYVVSYKKRPALWHVFVEHEDTEARGSTIRVPRERSWTIERTEGTRE